MTVLGMLLAGALGAWARYELSGWIQARTTTALPWGTAVVNVAGAAVLAALFAAQHAGLVPDSWLTVLGTGFVGAFTTFSTWMVESAYLAGEGGRAGLRAAAMSLGAPLVAGTMVAALILALT